MGLRFPEKINGDCFFVTTTFAEWNKYGDVPGMYEGICKSLVFGLEKYSGRMIGYVLMPSHLHLILFIEGKHLSNFMRDFKKFVSQKLAKDLEISDSKIWKDGYDTVAIYSEKVFRQKLDYVHNNPVEAGLVRVSDEWEWSSAGAYSQDIVEIVPIWKDWYW